MSDDRPVLPLFDHLDALRGDVALLGAITTEEVMLPASGTRYTIHRPIETDRLLDHSATDPEQNLPYWAEIWPSGLALADAICYQPDLVRGLRVLELGAGLGITAIAALAAGAELTVTDYAPEALVFSRLHALANLGREPATLQLNWRRPDPALFRLARRGFPVILAADVLYERRDVAPLLSLIDQVIAPGGLLWLAEPGRPVAAKFLEVARDRGWHGETSHATGPWPDPKDLGVMVGVHQLRRG